MLFDSEVQEYDKLHKFNKQLRYFAKQRVSFFLMV